MAIQVGDKVPSGGFAVKSADGIDAVSSDDLFNGKKVVLFSLPGAFTPTCSAKHLPGFINNSDALKAKGVDTIACLAVNDPFVMGAWGDAQGAAGKVTMLADGSGVYTGALGMELDLTERGLGVRGQRFAMVVEDGTVTQLAVEPDPGALDVSAAEKILAVL